MNSFGKFQIRHAVQQVRFPQDFELSLGSIYPCLDWPGPTYMQNSPSPLADSFVPSSNLIIILSFSRWLDSPSQPNNNNFLWSIGPTPSNTRCRYWWIQPDCPPHAPLIPVTHWAFLSIDPYWSTHVPLSPTHIWNSRHSLVHTVAHYSLVNSHSQSTSQDVFAHVCYRHKICVLGPAPIFCIYGHRGLSPRRLVAADAVLDKPGFTHYKGEKTMCLHVQVPAGQKDSFMMATNWKKHRMCCCFVC